MGEQSSALIEDTGPLLDSQAQTTDSLRTWATSLAGITGQVVANDPQVRTLLQEGPGAANEVSRLLDQVKPTLPILLANLTTVGQVAVTCHPSLEQVLVLLPSFVGDVLASAPENNPTGIPLGDFRVQLGDGLPCTVGFLPPSQWRSPAALDTPDTPDGLYCKLPQDSPVIVRGARNSPCMGVPGKRAPTVQECYSDKPYTPLAMRQAETPPAPPPVEAFPPMDTGGAVAATPSSFGGNESGPGPSVAVAHYDPQTGQYAAPGGQFFRQEDLVDPAKSWQDLIYMSGSWRVRRTVDNWEPCIDGTATTGEQTFTFWKGYPEAFPLKGWDITKGPSGACGRNKQLGVQLPSTLTPVT